MPKECLVVPTEILTRYHYIPPDIRDKSFYLPFAELGGFTKISELAKQYGKHMERFGDRGIEHNPSFQQLIMYGFVIRGDKFLIYERESNGAYDESRLAGLISVGLGGHMEPVDFNLEDTLWRETDEEAFVARQGKQVSFRDQQGNLLIYKMSKYLNITPLALLKDGKNEVGLCHLGIACKIDIATSNTSLGIRENGENKRYQYMTLPEYQQAVELGQITPEGWTQLVVENAIKPLLS